MTSKSITSKQQHYADAIESAIDIILFYEEEDEYECLSDESVVDDLVENFGYSLSDAHCMLGTAQEIHRYRQESGFYNE
jgi:hypothetical protein